MARRQKRVVSGGSIGSSSGSNNSSSRRTREVSGSGSSRVQSVAEVVEVRHWNLQQQRSKVHGCSSGQAGEPLAGGSSSWHVSCWHACLPDESQGLDGHQVHVLERAPLGEVVAHNLAQLQQAGRQQQQQQDGQQQRGQQWRRYVQRAAAAAAADAAAECLAAQGTPAAAAAAAAAELPGSPAPHSSACTRTAPHTCSVGRVPAPP